MNSLQSLIDYFSKVGAIETTDYSRDNKERFSLQETRLPYFLSYCSQVLPKKGSSSKHRKTHSIPRSNSFSKIPRDFNHVQEEWMKMDSPTRKQIKQAILKGLSSDEFVLSHTAAQAFVSLASLEGSGFNYLDNLNSIVLKPENKQTLCSALYSLSYFIKSQHEISNSNLTQGLFDNILHIFHESHDPEILDNCAKVFKQIAIFSPELFNKQSLLSIIKDSHSILFQICRKDNSSSYFISFHDFFSTLFQSFYSSDIFLPSIDSFTKACELGLTSDKNEVLISSLHLWTEIAKKERENCDNIISFKHFNATLTAVQQDLNFDANMISIPPSPPENRHLIGKASPRLVPRLMTLLSQPDIAQDVFKCLAAVSRVSPERVLTAVSATWAVQLSRQPDEATKNKLMLLICVVAKNKSLEVHSKTENFLCRTIPTLISTSSQGFATALKAISHFQKRAYLQDLSFCRSPNFEIILDIFESLVNHVRDMQKSSTDPTQKFDQELISRILKTMKIIFQTHLIKDWRPNRKPVDLTQHVDKILNVYSTILSFDGLSFFDQFLIQIYFQSFSSYIVATPITPEISGKIFTFLKKILKLLDPHLNDYFQPYTIAAIEFFSNISLKKTDMGNFLSFIHDISMSLIELYNHHPSNNIRIEILKCFNTLLSIPNLPKSEAQFIMQKFFMRSSVSEEDLPFYTCSSDPDSSFSIMIDNRENLCNILLLEINTRLNIVLKDEMFPYLESTILKINQKLYLEKYKNLRANLIEILSLIIDVYPNSPISLMKPFLQKKFANFVYSNISSENDILASFLHLQTSLLDYRINHDLMIKDGLDEAIIILEKMKESGKMTELRLEKIFDFAEKGIEVFQNNFKETFNMKLFAEFLINGISNKHLSEELNERAEEILYTIKEVIG